jgi:hypothetical protein
VLRQTTPGNYEVRLQVGKKKSDIVHVGSMKPFTQLHVAQFSILRENDASATQEEPVPDPSSRPVESLLQKTPAMGDTGNTIPLILTPEIQFIQKKQVKFLRQVIRNRKSFRNIATTAAP